MRIGIQLGMHGHAGRRVHPPPGWESIAGQVRTAEDVGFDLVVIEDALLDGGMDTYGYWEAASLAGAVAAVSSSIGIEHSMMNPPLRPPAVVASVAATLDEISGGRYGLGIGAGNTPADYEAFGIPADKRYSRAAEAIEIIHALLRTGSVDFEGDHHSASGELVPRGPTPGGPPLVVGAVGPKMIRLAVRFADKWNSWSPQPQTPDAFRPMVEELDRACEELGRDPATLERSIDVAVDPHALVDEPASGLSPYLISGGSDEIAEGLLGFGELGIRVVRCMMWPDRGPERRPELVAAMAGVVDRVHQAS